jgi:hypothetical protein
MVELYLHSPIYLHGIVLNSLSTRTTLPSVAIPPLWSSDQFLATDPEVPGSISGPSRFSEKQRIWNGVHSAS